MNGLLIHAAEDLGGLLARFTQVRRVNLERTFDLTRFEIGQTEGAERIPDAAFRRRNCHRFSHGRLSAAA